MRRAHPGGRNTGRADDVLSSVKSNSIGKLEVDGSRYSKKEKKKLIKALGSNTSVTTVIASQVFGGERLRQLWAACFEQNTSIREVNFMHGGMTAEDAKAVANGWRNNLDSAISRIDLMYNDIGNEGVDGLAVAFRMHLDRLESVQLESTGIDDAGVKTVCDSLVSSTSLKCISVGSNAITDASVAHILSVIGTWFFLEKLVISNCGIGDDGLAQLSQYLIENKPQIRKIWASGLSSATPRGHDHMFRAIPEVTSLCEVTLFSGSLEGNEAQQRLQELLNQNKIASGEVTAEQLEMQDLLKRAAEEHVRENPRHR